MAEPKGRMTDNDPLPGSDESIIQYLEDAADLVRSGKPCAVHIIYADEERTRISSKVMGVTVNRHAMY